MPRVVALALFAVIPLLVACASPTREGFQLDPVVPATADQLGVARDQLQGRVDLVRPGTRVTAVEGGLFVEMPLNEATPQFVERLIVRGDVAIVAVPADAEIPVAGQRLDLPPLIRQPGFTGARLSEVDGRQVLDLDLDLEPLSARLLAGHTAGHVGEALAIVVDGIVVSAPIIQAPIPDGRLQIASGTDDPEDDLAWIVGVLRHGVLEIGLTGGPYGNG